ncbi:hypothetical protein JTE90_017424 [Oedothorax gibbosus]|uniref:Corticotropin-releasing factor domain-containing protein n=1 Tax=Oedothorax gibbosus TaxID=931172 RepID=A0AAV6U5R6_9ARAC|nr:hypothetical protein JTE90_017424 [Oedothorax gibbosus]
MAKSCAFVLACWCAAALVVCHARVMQSRGLGALLGSDDPQPQQLLRWGVLLAAAKNSEDGDDASSEEQEHEVSKRRKGPTLSVVSPLEVLRQRLRLDRAKERIRENQKQIEAKAENDPSGTKGQKLPQLLHRRKPTFHPTHNKNTSFFLKCYFEESLPFMVQYRNIN